MKASFKEKNRKHPYINKIGSHPEMIRKYFWARISLEEIEKPTVSW